MKSIIEKSGHSRSFVSPSYASDVQKGSSSSLPFNLNWKGAAGVAVGMWALSRFPKTTLLGLLATGVYLGLNTNKDKNPFHGSGIVSDRDLH